MIGKNLIAAAGNGISTGDVAEAIDFDGTNDYLSRASDLTGNTDGKTFTFSAWFWYDGTATGYIYREFVSGQGFFHCRIEVSGKIAFTGANSSGTAIFLAEYDLAALPPFNRTFYNILVSVDLANTANRYWYVNDQLVSPAWTIYSNQNIDFTTAAHAVGANVDGSTKFDGRLSNVFLDYTYRDLSITANRRLFITADLKPAAGQNSVVNYLQNNFAFPNSIDNAKFFNNGSTIVYGGGSTDTAYSYDLSTPYDLKTAGSPASWQISGSGAWSGACFNSDGTKAYFANKNNADIYSHTNNTAFRINGSTNVSATLSTGGSTQDMMLANDDTQLYRLAYSASGGTIQQFSFGTPGDITTLTFVGQKSMNALVDSKTIESIYVDTLRGFVYTVDAGNYIREFQFNTPKEISTITSTGRTFFVGAFNKYVAVSQDYLLLGNSANAYIYNITNYDITTAFYGQSSGVSQAPILYLPLNDPTAPGANAGTGGNFTLTGTVARSGRGPNQYNAPYSDLDGTADYLSRTTALTGIADGKTFTLSFCFNKDGASNEYPFTIYSSTTKRLRVIVDSGGYITIEASSSAGTGVLYVESSAGSIALNRNYVITISVDLTDTAKRHLYINGSAATATWFTYSNTDIDFSPATPRYYAGYDANPANFFDGRLGALWFNTSYIDLSVAANLAKFVTGTGIDAKPVDLGASGELPTGTSPLIYLPMYGNNAGKNYGTGGDFTVNSGPYTGARGPNEFWSGSGLFNNPTQIELSALTLNNSPDVTNIQKTTFACCFKRRDVTVSDNSVIFNTTSSTNNNFHFSVYFTDTELLRVGWNGQTVATSTAITDTNWHTLLVSVDSTATVAHVYLDGVSLTATITLNRAYIQAFTYVGRATGVSADQCFDGNIGFIYQAHDYIDISQEANRLKFFDAFGYPVNLTQQVEDAAIPAPYVYLLFGDPSNLGANNGTAGDFTNFSVTASAYVKA